ncbi:MAG: hypothetical protein ACP5JG_19495 [Anaerolineae bacterium]
MNTPQTSDERSSEEQCRANQKTHNRPRTIGFPLLVAAFLVTAVLIYLGRRLISREEREPSEAKTAPPPATEQQEPVRITIHTGGHPSDVVTEEADRETESRPGEGKGTEAEATAILEASQGAQEQAPTEAPTEAVTKAVAEPAYVASEDSDRFHVPTCRWARQIKPENRIELPDRETALRKGYIPCGSCQP